MYQLYRLSISVMAKVLCSLWIL